MIECNTDSAYKLNPYNYNLFHYRIVLKVFLEWITSGLNDCLLVMNPT
jgi:hypothetical protein